MVRITCPFKDTVFLSDFDSDLTFFHGASSCETPYWTENFIEPILKNGFLEPPVSRLHRDHVLLCRRSSLSEIARPFQAWLAEQGFLNKPGRIFLTTSTHPIEDGFFRWLCIVCYPVDEPLAIPATAPLDWQNFLTDANTLEEALDDFIHQECRRLHDSMRFLDHLYPKKVLPRMFDTETAYLEFAAAVWSREVLNFWSRPVQYPK